MIKYKKYNNNSSYIEISNELFLFHFSKINLLKEIAFHENHWQLFIQLLKEKEKTLLEIGEEIFTEKTSTFLAKIVWILLDIAIQINLKTVSIYLEYHAHLCFNEHWIHRYAYFEYHGFIMKKNSRGNYLRMMLDKGAKELPSYIQSQIENIINYGKNDKLLPLKIIQVSRHIAKINIDNTEWKEITVDAHSIHVQSSVTKTHELLLMIKEVLNKKASLLVVAEKLKISPAIVIMYALLYYSSLFITSIKRNIRKQILRNQHISLNEALEEHIEQANNLLDKLRVCIPESYKKLIDISSKYQRIQSTYYKTFNQLISKKHLKQYRIGYIKNQKWYSFGISLDNIVDDDIANDIKRYAQYRALNNKQMPLIIVDLFTYIKSKNKQENIKATTLTEDNIANFFQKVSNNRNASNVKSIITAFYKYLLNIAVLGRTSDHEDIQSIYKLLSTDFTIINSEPKNPTKPLPEDVYLQIRNHLDEVSPDIRNATLITSSTGCRPSELANIFEDSLKYDKKFNCYILNINMGKQTKAYGKRGKKALRKVPIYDQDTIDAFQEQVELSKEARKESGNDSIFIRRDSRYVNQVKFYIPSTITFVKAINKLIKKYDIKSDLDDNLWHYTPYQMRSMLATTMVERGHAPEEIKAFFGWLTPHTIEKAYAYIRSKKLVEINTEFFKDHFRVSFNEETLKKYSRQDKEQIFVELYIHKRQMEYGECLRHPIMGECGKLQNPDSCADCARLITSHIYLKTWEKLLKNQQNIFNSLIKSLEIEGIPSSEYKTWAEYLIQKHRLDSYKGIVVVLSNVKENSCKH